MLDEPVNCGRCAMLSRRAQPGFGICGCNARGREIGKYHTTVSLDATCEHAKISAKFDPDFFPKIRAARLVAMGILPILPEPSPPAPTPTEIHRERHQTELF